MSVAIVVFLALVLALALAFVVLVLVLVLVLLSGLFNARSMVDCFSFPLLANVSTGCLLVVFLPSGERLCLSPAFDQHGIVKCW